MNTSSSHLRRKELFEIATELAGKISSSRKESFEASIVQITKDFERIEEKTLECVTEKERLPRPPMSIILKPVFPEHPGKWSEADLRCLQVWEEDAALQRKADEKIAMLLSEAQQLKELNDRRYQVSSWASYILYALGWGLGLVGRLLGVEGVAEGAD